MGEITLDGRLDEQAWRAAQPAGGFVQSYPNATQTNYYAIFTRSVPTTAVGAYTLTIQ